MKGADNIFIGPDIDGGFAADAAVGHPQERRGHVGPGHAAHIYGCDKAGNVLHDTAAHGEERRAARRPLHSELFDERRYFTKVLRVFTGCDFDEFTA